MKEYFINIFQTPGDTYNSLLHWDNKACVQEIKDELEAGQPCVYLHTIWFTAGASRVLDLTPMVERLRVRASNVVSLKDWRARA